jgi:cytochrome c peroxidase
MTCVRRNRVRTILATIGLALAAGCSPAPAEVPPTSPPPESADAALPPVGPGAALFHDHAFAALGGGNGRACSDCHMDSDRFQLSPASVEARFQQMSRTGVDDPLFRPIDADDFVANGESAHDYGNLRQSGLVRVRMPLPPNLKLVDPASCQTAGVPAPCMTATSYLTSAATLTDVWRSVPSVLNVSLSGSDPDGPVWPRGPNSRGGYQLDGRADTLPDQARAAFLGHAQVKVAPDARMLDDIAAYETGLLAEAEPPLDELETRGKAVFDRACGQCHGGPGKSTPLTGSLGIVRFFDDVAACPHPVDVVSPARWNLPPCSPALARNEQTYEITFADGFKTRRTSSDPGRALLSGFVFSGPVGSDGSCAHQPCGLPFADDWQKLEVAPLHGISKTAPYFHNNSAATLEEVVIHYEELYKRTNALSPPPEMPHFLTTDGVHRDRANVPSERAALVAYLMRL